MNSQVPAIDPQAPNSAAAILIGTSAKQAAAAAALNSEHSSGSANSGIATDSCSNVFGCQDTSTAAAASRIQCSGPALSRSPCPASAASHPSNASLCAPDRASASHCTSVRIPACDASADKPAGGAAASPHGSEARVVPCPIHPSPSTGLSPPSAPPDDSDAGKGSRKRARAQPVRVKEEESAGAREAAAAAAGVEGRIGAAGMGAGPGSAGASAGLCGAVGEPDSDADSALRRLGHQVPCPGPRRPGRRAAATADGWRWAPPPAAAGRRGRRGAWPPTRARVRTHTEGGGAAGGGGHAGRRSVV